MGNKTESKEEEEKKTHKRRCIVEAVKSSKLRNLKFSWFLTVRSNCVCSKILCSGVVSVVCVLFYLVLLRFRIVRFLFAADSETADKKCRNSIYHAFETKSQKKLKTKQQRKIVFLKMYLTSFRTAKNTWNSKICNEKHMNGNSSDWKRKQKKIQKRSGWVIHMSTKKPISMFHREDKKTAEQNVDWIWSVK